MYYGAIGGGDNLGKGESDVSKDELESDSTPATKAKAGLAPACDAQPSPARVPHSSTSDDVPVQQD